MILLLAELLNYVLSFSLWLIVGRYVLKLVTAGRTTFISEIFRRGTEPWFSLVRRITPDSVSSNHIPFLSLLLIINLRILLSLVIGPLGGSP